MQSKAETVNPIPKWFHVLTLSLLLTIQEPFADSVDQDQTAQNVQSDLWSTLSTFFNLYCFLIFQWQCIFSQWKSMIYLFGSERVNRLPYNHAFERPWGRSLLKLLWEKEKMLVTGDNTGNQHFTTYCPTMFSTLSNIKIIILATFDL